MMAFYIDVGLNLIIFLTTAFIFLKYFRMEKVEGKYTGWQTLRFFTTLSNLFSGIACFFVLIAEIRIGLKGCFVALPGWLHVLKFISTSSVALTFFTVMFYLGPTKGYKPLLSGTSFYMHLVGPVLAMVSLCFFENQEKIALWQALLGLIPTAAYAAVYLNRVVTIGEENGGWPDLYGFNRGGKWKLTSSLMILGSLIICLVLMWIHN